MKAGSHAPKTYLVKISGKPDERALARLRAGVTIELEDGERVKTSPAKIRLAEDGANPWYEVILIEGGTGRSGGCFRAWDFLWRRSSACNWGRWFWMSRPGNIGR